MVKYYILEFRKEKSSFFGEVGNFFKKTKQLLLATAILVGSIVAGIALFFINPFVASAILDLGLGVSRFNLSVARHFKNGRQSSSSMKFLGLKMFSRSEKYIVQSN
ncbi:hypothetical protein [Bacteroidetes bacterium endosymbiont of Geopemphigus sp.]|uniref:hypothetical protein n=1 Tax=Bacteroidetes bacterium endosymbiont of Geopemphigus sp. TaxID=2047937 RepID=UPI000CD1675E|nr:hypothetical protein [Bacteroidetes bacterium endosymbiont of Geopemphigus sp.]